MLAKLYKARGQSDEAYDHLEKYLEVKEKLSSDASRQRFEALQIKFDVDQNEREKNLYREQNIKLTEMNSELERLSQELFRQANEDPLTGLYNRRRLEQELEKELSRVQRTSGKLTVMIGDIDNFKQINDRFSHQVG
jgi:PleD family two-component response regulator